jgi:hypothetical protein
MKLSQCHIKLLQQLIELPTNRRLGMDVPPAFIDLVAAGYAKMIPIGITQHLAEITETGREALAVGEHANDVRITLDSSGRMAS